MELLQPGENCPICDMGVLELKQKEFNFEYKGHNTPFNKEVLVCSSCDDSFLKDSDEKEMDRYLTDERRKIDRLLTSEEIRQVRKLYDVTQVKFAEIFEVGKKNFARYETGAATQSRSMDKLLRVLRKYPFAIDAFSDFEYQSVTANSCRAFPNTPTPVTFLTASEVVPFNVSICHGSQDSSAIDPCDSLETERQLLTA